MDYYSTKDVSRLTGASRPIIRTYTQRYARFLSTEATPEAGAERRFTAADLKVIAYIYQRTSAGATHEQVLERLAAGELDQFDWQPPEEPPGAATGPQSAESASSTALVPYERLQTAQALMLDAQRREEQALDQVATLRAEVQRLSIELGKAQGEAATLRESRYTAPRWWRAIFGGRQGDAPG